MIAKANWFNRRKYTGWGLSPKTWQGVIYIIIIAAVLALIQALPLGIMPKMALTGTWTAFVLIDTLQAMAAIRLDEREQKVEAVAERNASWTMVASTVLVVIYVITVGRDFRGVELVPVLILPVVVGTIVKGATNFFLDRRGI